MVHRQHGLVQAGEHRKYEDAHQRQKLRGVFLFHDTHEQTIEALPEILDRLIATAASL